MANNCRVVIVANKWWEADPLCAVLIHDRARPSVLTGFRFLNYPAARQAKPRPGDPRPVDPTAAPRLTFLCGRAVVEVWCAEELMNPAENSSSSLEKSRVLARAMNCGAPLDLVIAFGTAGAREGVAANGSVVVGRRVFVHDPLASMPDRTGMWTPPEADVVVDSAYPVAALGKIDEQARYAAEARSLKSPIHPADPLVLLSNGLVSVGVVNVSNYDDYVWADKAAIAAFRRLGGVGQVGSIETTHAVIRAASRAPFLYVSGISDTEGLFDFEVTPRVYSQNFVAAHNAALALAWLLPSIVTQLPQPPDISLQPAAANDLLGRRG